MANEERKIQYGIKGKLISAIAMLLVAVIMTVSSTYAWFTLSTAPEVTGISTAVGANGALEMFLLTGSTANGTEDVFGDKNTLWGNLVNLSAHATYGTDRINLYPSKLNTSLSNQISMNSPLQFPKYGADGRINGEFGSTMLSGGVRGSDGKLTNFVENDLWGFRAIGTTSGLSDREIALRSATANVNIYATQAKDKAELSLTEHGSVLADMAIQKVMRDNPNFGDDEYNAVAGMIARLEEALAILDKSYQQAILAWAASGATTANDTVYDAVKVIVENDGQYADINAVIAAVTTKFAEWNAIPEVADLGVTLALPTWITGTPADGENAPTALEQYKAMKLDVEDAKTKLMALLNDNNSTETEGVRTPNPDAVFSYADLSGALRNLVNMDKLKINNIALDSEGSKQAIYESAISTRMVTVSMVTGTGVYADMADQAGNYQASIEVDVGALAGATGVMFGADMKAETTLRPTYLQRTIDEAKRVGAPTANAEATPFSEYYGYIVDLAFRTNAAASNLLLQQEAIDRIYADNNNEATMGHGSTMSFASASTGFPTDKVKALMSHIRIVFFNPDVKDGGCDIYAYAKLDMSKAEVSNGQVTAPMYLYETVTAYTLDNATVYRSEPVVTTNEDGTTTTTYTYYSDSAMKTLVDTVSDDAENEAIAQTAKTVEVEKEDRIITALTQNALQKVSALVYLDGETITNADVAAEAAASMTGTANFQFASDAKLQPMEYGDLHTPNAPEANP